MVNTVGKNLVGAALLAIGTVFVAACGNSSTTSGTPTGPSPTVNLTGTWSGSASDSSSSVVGPTGMMGQQGMGDMTLQFTQSGDSVTATMTFAGEFGHMPGSMTGTISGDTLTFTMTMPMGSMMSACAVSGSGTMQISGNTMTGTYSGSNSCDGPFNGGHMTLTRQ